MFGASMQLMMPNICSVSENYSTRLVTKWHCGLVHWFPDSTR